MATFRLCSIPDCDKPVVARGWCINHYNRWRHHSDPLGGGIGRGEAQRYFHEVVLAYEGNECLTWPYSLDASGYGRVTFNGKHGPVSRRICEQVFGPAPSVDHQAAHSCGKGHLGCVNPKHVSWKTPADNAADRHIHGTMARGQKIGISKLTETKVREIRALKGKLPDREIAVMFGVSRRNISAIHCGVSWSWLI